MKSAIFFLLVASAFARIVPVSLYGKAEDRIPGEYVLQFEEDARVQFAEFKTQKFASALNYHEFGDFMGVGGKMTEDELEFVQRFPGVKLIEPNQIYRALGNQTNVAAWGIDRSDQRNRPLNRLYQWNRAPADGSGVDVFVLDTGINTNHANFNGRALFAADCISGSCQTGSNPGDPNGHGTHCAGSVASTTYGIAKNTRVFNVRVLGANGSGSTNGIMAGVSHVNNRAGTKVISLSLGGGFSSAFNNAIDASHRAGVVNVVAAGNSNSNACNASPASAPLALTVGATDINDNRASFSSFGSCVDVFAPGVNVLSTTSNGGTGTLSGTSMSCPHVAGGIALIRSRGATTATGAVNTLISESTTGVVSNPGAGSPNRLFFTNPTNP